METMLQDPKHPNLQDKDVVLAFTPKYGEPISHMMGVSQSLSALLHKGSLEGVNSLTLDLSGVYDDKDKPLYSNLKREALSPPHLYNGERMTDVVPDRKTYDDEIKGYLEDFSKQHLNGIPIGVGDNIIADTIAKNAGVTARVDATFLP